MSSLFARHRESPTPGHEMSGFSSAQPYVSLQKFSATSCHGDEKFGGQVSGDEKSARRTVRVPAKPVKSPDGGPVRSGEVRSDVLSRSSRSVSKIWTDQARTQAGPVRR